ncbi:uncharacterized protein SPAPADRAFT_59342 [Spathaspora passalidarum NRRL Y-27907]|uniref:3-ketodihydrosphingosine reductase TSC10 n=1 Tax=Spathaspora passalidarum (strain NRRL Y-27907 / 11-Y1) TaxID=619300 RepID=G3AJP9_SPAPN|nr:uncharacterized protein SPAPADRAFT_59342 [Spathaspora passalidarum NRRL Y-27907]EGW33950.1 hypothetical protein SPAPADRAFT_59342 [Spathaspora passalidarum NRRL Y-27907]
MWFSKSNFPTAGKTAIIIGASQGIGADLALKLYQKNCSVILVARTESKLIQQITRIKSSIGENENVKLSYYTCDVSNYDNCVDLWQKVVNDGNDPDIIFCCAGSSVPKLFNDLTKQDIQSGITINYNTAINTIHTGFKQLLEKENKHRHVILFSSVVSFYPFIGYSQYAPMKAAIQSLSIVLRQELAPYNYRVSCIFPGNFQSEGYEQEQLTKPEITKKIEGSSHAIPGEECADLIIDQLSKGYDTVTTDFIGWLLGCSVLGVLPRQWGFFQIIVSFLFSIFAPLANWFVNRDIQDSFDKSKKD